MKRIYILLAVALLVSGCSLIGVPSTDNSATTSHKQDPRKPNRLTPQVPRTLDFPYYASCSPMAEDVTIERIEVQRKQTKVYFQYRDRTPQSKSITDDGLYIMPEVYMEDASTGRRYELIRMDGITAYPERTYFAENKGGYDILPYSLTFEALGEETDFVNIVEPGHSGYNFYGVDVRTPMKEKDEVKQ